MSNIPADQFSQSNAIRRQSLHPLDTTRQFASSSQLLQNQNQNQSISFTPPDIITKLPHVVHSNAIQLKHLTRGINGLPPFKDQTTKNDNIISGYDTTKDEMKHGFENYVEVAEGSTSMTDLIPEMKMMQGRSRIGMDGVVGGGDAAPAAGSSIGKGNLDKTTLPPKTVHDPYVMSQWAELKKLDGNRPWKSSIPGIVNSPQLGAGTATDEDASATAEDIPTVMRDRLRNILDLQMEIYEMQIKLENKVGPSGNMATDEPTSHSNDMIDKEGTSVEEKKEDTMNFDALKKREEGVTAIFDKIESLSSVIRSFHEIPQPILSFPFESSSTPAESEPPDVVTTQPTTPHPFVQPPVQSETRVSESLSSI